MALLRNNSAFNVNRGWASTIGRNTAVDETRYAATVHTYAETGTTPLKPGMCVIPQVASNQSQWRIPLVDADVNLSADKKNPHQFYMVVEGNSQYEYAGRMVNKAVAIRGTFQISTQHVKGTLAVGNPVCPEHAASGSGATLVHAGGVNEGRLQLAGSGDPVIGRIIDIETLDGANVYVIDCEF